MLPTSRYQMPSPQNHCPTCTAAPPLMSCEWRPYSGSCGPVQFHGCCNHSCFPGYYGFPPYHQMAPPTPFHWHGYRPMYPDPYPLQYPPAPYYTAEQSTPECGKIDSGNHHFCGFTNHGPNQRGGSTVKTEEPVVDDGKKETESMVPAGLKDCPYPILWIPPGYMKSEENRAPVQSDRKQQGEDNATSPKSLNKSMELEPGVWKSSFPPDSNDTRSLKHRGEEKRNQQFEDKNARFPFPIIWMPTETVEEGRENEHEQNNPAEEPNSSFKIIPMKLPGSDGSEKTPRATKGSPGGLGGSKMMEKTTNQKIIPVREAHGEENTTKGKGEGNASKHGEDGVKDEHSDSARRQSPSSPRTAKLPPVCLRVDPLPRKKNGDNNSRSPSPPDQRTKSRQTSKASHPEELKGFQETIINRNHGRDPNLENIKVVEVVEHTAGENVHNETNSGSQNQIPTCAIAQHSEGFDDPTAAAGEHQAENNRGRDSEGQISEAIERQAAMDLSHSDNSKCKKILVDKAGSGLEERVCDEAPKVKKNKLSDEEAAVMIQAAYRGFEVRKWEPLKKLKQLAKVSEDAGEIRNRIQALKNLSDFKGDNRQRVMIGEAIMSLLLKLDAIQGLHPNLRSTRKSLAKELVRLQEELDSLMTLKPEAPVAEEPTAKLVENFTNIECLAGGADGELTSESLEVSSPGDNSEKTSNFTEPSQGAQMMDTSAKTQGQDTSEPMSSKEEVEDILENGTAGVQEKNDMVLHAADMGPAFEESKDEQENGSQDVSQVMSEPISGTGLDGPVELPSIAEERNHELGLAEGPMGDTIYDLNAAKEIEGEEVGDIRQPIKEAHVEINDIEELPLGLIEGQTAMESVPQLDKDDKIEAGNVEVQEGCQIGGRETNAVTMEDYAAPTVNDQEQFSFDENLEENPAIPAVIESKNGENIEAAEAEVLESSQDECDEVTISTSHDDEGPGMNQSEEQLPEAETEDWVEMHKGEVSETDGPQPVVPFLEKEHYHKEDDQEKGEIDVECTKDDTQKKAVPIEDSQEKSLEGVYEGSETARFEVPGTDICRGAIDNEVVIHNTGDEADEKLIEENRKLREMMEQMINAGKEHLTVISNLTRRVKDLERKLSRKKKLKSRRHRAAPPCPIPVSPGKYDSLHENKGV